MPLIIGASPNPVPFDFGPPIVERKYKWTDDWTVDPEFTVVSFGVEAGSAQPASCELLRRYGITKEPHETDYFPKAAMNLRGVWVRVYVVGEQSPVIQFMGRIESPTRNLKGDTQIKAGEQAWIAVGGLRILQKMHVSQAMSLQGGNLSTLGWIPAMNAKGKRNLLVGNRSTSPVNGIYYYGGKEVWTHGQYIDYLLASFVQQYDKDANPSGPVWTVGGQRSVVDQMKTTIPFEPAGTAADMLKKLIPVKCGIDYYVTPTDKGFEITIFSLSREEISAGGVTLPKNPNVITIDKGSNLQLPEVKLVETQEQRYDEIQVLGKRIVVCGTLRGPRAFVGGSSGNPDASLVKRWASDIEILYQTANGNALTPSGGGGYVVAANSDADVNDEIRKTEMFRDVYQHLGAPTGWDLDKGRWGVVCGDDGKLTDAKTLREQTLKQNPNLDPATLPGYTQTALRETLSWLPLFEGFDYSTDPPTDHTLNDGTANPDVKAPMAFVKDEDPDTGTAPRYVQCDGNGISVHAPKEDWGVFLNASPNHTLALNHWNLEPLDPQDNSNLNTTNLDSLRYDYETVAATIAIEADHRLHLGFKLADNQKAGDGSVKIIMDEEAEAWVMLPGTVVGVGADGTLTQIPQSDMVVLRNDTDRLGMILAGEIARYKNDRVRGVLTFRQHLPFAFLLGRILDVIQQGDDLNQVGGPITSVEWILSPPQTIVKTGYA